MIKVVLLFSFTLISLKSFAKISPNNYECTSIATPVINGQYEKEDIQKKIVGFVKTPHSTGFIYANLGTVEFQHHIGDQTIHMAAQTGIISSEYQPGVRYSHAIYLHLSSSLTDPANQTIVSSQFDVPDSDLPARFGIRLADTIQLENNIFVLMRLDCKFNETVGYYNPL